MSDGQGKMRVVEMTVGVSFLCCFGPIILIKSGLYTHIYVYMQSMVPTYMELQWHRNLCYTWHRESIASVCVGR